MALSNTVFVLLWFVKHREYNGSYPKLDLLKIWMEDTNNKLYRNVSEKSIESIKLKIAAFIIAN